MCPVVGGGLQNQGLLGYFGYFLRPISFSRTFKNQAVFQGLFKKHKHPTWAGEECEWHINVKELMAAFFHKLSVAF